MIHLCLETSSSSRVSSSTLATDGRASASLAPRVGVADGVANVLALVAGCLSCARLVGHHAAFLALVQVFSHALILGIFSVFRIELTHSGCGH